MIIGIIEITWNYLVMNVQELPGNECANRNSNLKKFWGYVKSLRRDACGVSPLKKEGITHSSSEAKSEILNQQFASVFTKEDTSEVPEIPGPSPYPDLPPIQVNVQGVSKLLSGLNPHKAMGPDQVHARFLKEVAVELAPALTQLYQATLDQGKIPEEWRKALVTPLFKKGERAKASNYRPVSLTSICCKLLEHIIHHHIMDHFDLHHVLNDAQHGFRKRRSCETQLILTVQDLAKGLDEKSQIDAVLLDFSKAFDKVPHQRLHNKLYYYGVRGQVLLWIDDFLAGRSQSVVCDGHQSTPCDVMSGVPQGMVLGPLLFLTYINDLPEAVSSQTRLFADDALVYREISCPEDAQVLQNDLNALQQWEAKWLMHFNPDKCEVLRITQKRKHIIQADYTIHDQNLQVVKEAK